MKEYIFTKDYKLIGEENLEIEIEEQDSLIKVEFEELETAPQEYVVSVSSSGNGVATATPRVATKGTLITLKDMPVIGYKLESYEVLSGGVVIRDNKFILGNSDVSIRANFEEITYTVSFDMQGYGTQLAPEIINYGSTATEPTTPVDTQAIFGGWYTEAGCINEFNFDTPIFADTVLYAKWDVVCLSLTSSEPITVEPYTKGWDGVIEYSTDKRNWIEWDGSQISSDKIYLRGSNNTVVTGSTSGRWVWGGSNVYCSGNIESLLDYATVSSDEHPTMGNSCYSYLFYNSPLVTAPQLPATTLTNYCYRGLFSSCGSLLEAPELPATTMVDYCYANMFQGCALSTMPALPAMTLASNCYYEMFGECESLVNVSTLPATTLAEQCYTYMFYRCKALTTPPALPAINLATRCYSSMFRECASLTTTPTLNATTLASGCYDIMFSGCTSITTPPVLPATTLVDSCYNGMFSGCTSLATVPTLSATTLAISCYRSMFSGCSALTTPPILPSTTLAQSCYQSMFNGCTSLTTPPELPATTLASECYDYMFAGCTSLTTAPELPATTLARGCYDSMFFGCTLLTVAPLLPATTLKDECYESMFYGCTSLVAIPALPATAMQFYCYKSMFRNCSSLKLSATQSEDYPTPYRIPIEGTGSNAYDAITYMFTGTGGTFASTPSLNTTYYLHKDNHIVDEWDVVVSRINSGSFNEEVGYTVPITDSFGTYDMELIAIDTDELMSGGVAKTTWLAKQIMAQQPINLSSQPTAQWSESSIRSYLRDTILPGLPAAIQSHIKTVKKYTREYQNNAFVDVASAETIFLISKGELSNQYATEPYEKSGCKYEMLFKSSGRKKETIVPGVLPTKVWWLRSCESVNNKFYRVASDGAIGGTLYDSYYGIAYAFCI